MPAVAAVPSKRFVVSSVSSDAHMWNLVFLQLLLEEHGGEVTNLGACVPDEVVLEACRREQPDLLVLSTVNGQGHLDALRLVRRIRKDRALGSLRAVIGGKFGVHGTKDGRIRGQLVAAGFDAVFEGDGGIAEFDAFLNVLETSGDRGAVSEEAA